MQPSLLLVDINCNETKKLSSGSSLFTSQEPLVDYPSQTSDDSAPPEKRRRELPLIPEGDSLPLEQSEMETQENILDWDGDANKWEVSEDKVIYPTRDPYS